MSVAPHAIVRDAARLYTPLIVLFSASLLFERAPGAGVGFVAGLAFSLILALHALIFGADAARAAAPPLLTRALLAAGVLVSFVGAGAPGLRFSPQLIEAGAFVATSSAASLFLVSLMGRAATLLGEER